QRPWPVDVKVKRHVPDSLAVWWKATMAASRASRLLGPLRRYISGTPPSPPALPRRFVALWGNGDHGRLGLGDLGSRWRPALCPFVSDDCDLPVYVACGGAHTLFLTEKGHVYATGLNNFGQLGITTDTGHALVPIKASTFPKKITQISAGYHHSAAITGSSSSNKSDESSESHPPDLGGIWAVGGVSAPTYVAELVPRQQVHRGCI
ncbi:hypothetical protein Taro_018834, partial [Colocasia esculenta]|nr:hypothetical protein [Colocasia esculenta]